MLDAVIIRGTGLGLRFGVAFLKRVANERGLRQVLGACLGFEVGSDIRRKFDGDGDHELMVIFDVAEGNTLNQ